MLLEEKTPCRRSRRLSQLSPEPSTRKSRRLSRLSPEFGGVDSRKQKRSGSEVPARKKRALSADGKLTFRTPRKATRSHDLLLKPTRAERRRRLAGPLAVVVAVSVVVVATIHFLWSQQRAPPPALIPVDTTARPLPIDLIKAILHEAKTAKTNLLDRLDPP